MTDLGARSAVSYQWCVDIIAGWLLTVMHFGCIFGCHVPNVGWKIAIFVMLGVVCSYFIVPRTASARQKRSRTIRLSSGAIYCTIHIEVRDIMSKVLDSYSKTLKGLETENRKLLKVCEADELYVK